MTGWVRFQNQYGEISIPADVFEKFNDKPFDDTGTGYRGKSFCVSVSPPIMISKYIRYCVDCKKENYMMFMVHDALWKVYGKGGSHQCIKCFEKGLIRPLCSQDLIPNLLINIDVVRWLDNREKRRKLREAHDNQCE